VTPDDFAAMVAHEWLEDDQLEFKRALPTADGVENGVSEVAQRGLCKEVVAFAHRLDGHVILGSARVGPLATRRYPTAPQRSTARRSDIAWAISCGMPWLVVGHCVRRAEG